jgi:hypothetical protein
LSEKNVMGIFRAKLEEETGELKTFHDEEIHNS